MNRSPVVFKRYLDRPRCAVAAIAALSIAERAIIKAKGEGSRTFESWDDIIGFGRQTGIRNRSGVAVDVYRYLMRPGLRNGKGAHQSVQLKAGDTGPLEHLSKEI